MSPMVSTTAQADTESAPPHARAWVAALDVLRARLRELIVCIAEGAPSPVEHAPAPMMAARLIEPLMSEPRFVWLCDTFGLDAVDAAIMLIVAGPDLDDEIAKHYARLQRNATATRAAGALCLRLLSDDESVRLAMHERFAASRPLVRQRLLIAADGTARMADPWRAAPMMVDPQILRTLLYDDVLDARVATYGRLLEVPARAPVVALSDDVWRAVTERARATAQMPGLAKFLFRGVRGSGRRDAAQRLAAESGLPCLAVDLAHLRNNGDFADLVAPLFREAWLRDALLYAEGLDTLTDHGMLFEVEQFLQNVQDDGGKIVLAVRPGWLPPNGRAGSFEIVEFGEPDARCRRRLWREALAKRGRRVRREALEVLAERFWLNPAQIEAAAAQLRRETDTDADALPELLRAARAQAPQDLLPLARKVHPASGWQDLVLPADAVRQLHELCARVAHRARVLDRWGFGAKLNLGKGTSALFAGPSGTGKTMAAEVVAGELGLDLYKIDLAAVVSKYIGETEKNLDRVFQAARHANAILLFDEADAIFGKRSEVRDAHDRYANLEVAYLLQKMEEYDGLAILSTNLKQNLDEAFLRRLTYTVLFPFPDVADRETIWRRIWPATLPLADDVNFVALATRCKLSGGSIKNAALAAAYFAATEGTVVHMRHIVHAIRRELQKSGKAVPDAEYADLLHATPAPERAHG